MSRAIARSSEFKWVAFFCQTYIGRSTPPSHHRIIAVRIRFFILYFFGAIALIFGNVITTYFSKTWYQKGHSIYNGWKQIYVLSIIHTKLFCEKPCKFSLNSSFFFEEEENSQNNNRSFAWMCVNCVRLKKLFGCKLQSNYKFSDF